MLEIEKKAYLRDPEVLNRIKKIADYQGYYEKEDRYYGPCKAKIDIKKDSIFRLRKENEKQILSYKRKKIIGKSEVNEENEFDLSSVSKGDLEGFFQYLGFQPFIDKNKKSHLYIIRKKNGFHVSIEHNEIEGLGEFVEIEILADHERDTDLALKTIDQLFEELGIKEEDIENRYYIDLLLGGNKR